MKMLKKIFVIIFLASSIASAQVEKNNGGDEIISVPKKYVSAEGLNHQNTSTTASGWIGIGREIGIATREGLDAVVDTAEKFGATKVGNFVMIMIAWKIMAKDVLGVIIGIPLLFAGVAIWIWAMKRLFFGYRVLDKVEGKTKFYKDHPAYQFKASDARSGVGFASVVLIALWIGLMTFAVIF